MSPIAISLVSQNNITINQAAIISKNCINEIINNKIISKNTLLNINIPDTNDEKPLIEFTRLGKRGEPVPATKNRENDFYNIGAAGRPLDDKPGTDFYAITQNKVSISPIDYDLTNKEILVKLEK